MQYQTYAPPDNLKHLIRYFWSLRNDKEITALPPSLDDSSGIIMSNNPVTTLRAFPDGCPGVIMVQSETALCEGQQHKLPEIYLHGQPIKAAELSYSNKFSALGVSFQPHALQSIFGIDANELTNKGIDFTSLQPDKISRLSEQLVNEPSMEGRVTLLSSYLLTKHQTNVRQTDEVVKFAVAQILGAKGNLALKDLHQHLQLSERSLERKFNQAIGITPKLFARICRFQESMKQLQFGQYFKLSDIAYENDYTDQSYFIREFKEFSGFSPLAFKKQFSREYELINSKRNQP
jgi:AraC-like DNA-binding protein